MLKGPQKPVCDVQLGFKKETGHKANGKQEQSIQGPNPIHIPAQLADLPASWTHTKGGNKENEQETGKPKGGNKENEQETGKPKTAKYVNYSAIIHHL